MDIGEKIRSARLNKQMTQAEVAGDKITRNMLSAIESGKSLPSMSNFFYICEYLDISPMDFFNFENPRPQELRKINFYLSKLSNSQFKNIEEIVIDLANIK